MGDLELMQLGLKATCLFFAFAFGACAGSLINVLAYRLPLGLGVLTPPSRCPACGTQLSMGKENIPVLGWLLIGGKCRYCKSRVSAEYPLVELTVGLFFAVLLLVWYQLPENATWLGVDFTAGRPTWARMDAWDGLPRASFAIYVVTCVLLAGLVAMTLTDVKTYTIPLVLPWFVTAVGVLGHFAGALTHRVGTPGGMRFAPGWIWSIPTPGGNAPQSPATWWWIGAALGGVVGIGVSLALLHFRLIRRSFEDYQEWEESHRATAAATSASSAATSVAADETPATSTTPEPAKTHEQELEAARREAGEGLVGEHAGQGVRLVVRFVLVWIASVLAFGFVGPMLAPRLNLPVYAGAAFGFLIGPLLAALACRTKTPAPGSAAAGSTSTTEQPAEMWIQYPHARREMLKELVFLTPVIGLAWGLAEALKAWATHHTGVDGLAPLPPMWVLVLAGSVLGYLIACAIVWGIRIAGSLAFGKEAMGLGDVHLMGAVGACLGWIDAAIAIPLAAVVGLYWVVVSTLAGKPGGRAMPFGPYLAAATVLVLFFKPLVERGLSSVVQAPVILP